MGEFHSLRNYWKLVNVTVSYFRQNILLVYCARLRVQLKPSSVYQNYLGLDLGIRKNILSPAGEVVENPKYCRINRGNCVQANQNYLVLKRF